MTFTLHHGDCLEVMAGMEAGSVDAVVTDPPYGVGFKYANDDDSRDGYEDWCLDWLAEARRVARVVIFTPGVRNIHVYPQPLWTVAYFKPGSTRRNGTGGFNEWEPILVYADKFKLKTDAGRYPDCVNHSQAWEVGSHPCPKPLRVFKWILSWLRDSEGSILDPFTGSGTTGVACIEEGRHFIGIEREAEYVAIARLRIEAAAAQTRLSV